jgi:phosphate transport system substrate-binding protein
LARTAAIATLALCATVAGAVRAQAQSLDELPQYQPEAHVAGTIRIWGHGSFKSDFMGRVFKSWAEGFAKYQPDVKLENHLYGTASAIGALALGEADVALLGEEISPAAAAMFARAKHYPPLGIDVATGSLDTAYFDYAHVVFVHKDNPISRLTLQQLDSVFGAEHRRGPRNARTWGELGLPGAWANRTIQPYGWKDLDFSLFVQSAVLGGSHRWNGGLREFSHVPRSDGTTYEAGQQILDALAGDRDGIAISSLHYANPQVKPIALAVTPDKPFYAATKENLIAQDYPLTRIVPAFVDRAPGRPLDPKVREFLRYVLSREGQRALVQETGYLQLSAPALRAQLAKLGPATATASAPANARAETASPGTVRVWSSTAMSGVVARWAAGYRKAHPDARIAATASGSDLAAAGLYTGRADVALLGREPTASEVQAFEWVYRVKPMRVEVMSGSVDAAEKSPALAVLVNRDNPLAKLTLAQLDAVFSDDGVRAGTGIRTWGQLGLGGGWAARPIELYGPDITTGTGVFFRHAVLHDSRKLHWDRMHELAGEQIAGALARDRFGIAVAPLGFAAPQLKTLALASDPSGPFVAPAAANVASRSYPLARSAYALVKRLPGRSLDPAVADFLRYVLSDDGQADVAREGAYLPLPATLVRNQIAALDETTVRIPTKIYAQQLVDETAARASDLLVVAMRATPTKSSQNVIVASNIGRIGSASDQDDLRVIETGVPKLESTADGTRFRAELPLHDTSGVTVGALDVTLPSKPGADRAVLQRRAEQLRDGLSRRILNAANLFDPYPLDPAVTTKSRAQRIVDRAMANHSELLSLALHVTLPNSGENVILGSSFGRIGKRADEDDMKVIESGTTVPGIFAGGKRYGLELALRDAHGKTIGALSVAYPYKAGDEPVMLARAERLRDELRQQFDSADQLAELDP